MIDFPSADEVLIDIATNPVTLPLMLMRGHSRFIEFIRTTPHWFDGHPKSHAYMFFLDCCTRLHRLDLLNSNVIDFTVF